MLVRLLPLPDIDIFLEHVSRHMAESGTEGTPVFSPLQPGLPWDAEAARLRVKEAWEKTLEEPGWCRAWGTFDGASLIGHIDLKTMKLPSALHRATIGIGVESSHRRQGVGSLLLQAAVDWAQEQPALVWLDLEVFAHNHAAIKLYEAFHFVQVGAVLDRFRINGKKIDDLQMVHRIRE